MSCCRTLRSFNQAQVRPSKRNLRRNDTALDRSIADSLMVLLATLCAVLLIRDIPEAGPNLREQPATSRSERLAPILAADRQTIAVGLGDATDFDHGRFEIAPRIMLTRSGSGSKMAIIAVPSERSNGSLVISIGAMIKGRVVARGDTVTREYEPLLGFPGDYGTVIRLTATDANSAFSPEGLRLFGVEFRWDTLPRRKLQPGSEVVNLWLTRTNSLFSRRTTIIPLQRRGVTVDNNAQVVFLQVAHGRFLPSRPPTQFMTGVLYSGGPASTRTCAKSQSP